MAGYLNPIAELNKPDSGELILPIQAFDKRDNSKFFCPDYDCKDTERILTVKKSNKGNYFFCHRPNCEHDIRPETLLHKLAIKWFIDKEQYEIPFSNQIKRQFIELDKSKTVCEFRQLQRIIPDVILSTFNDFLFAIEIVVTSDIDENKAKLINEFHLPTIRVNLSNFYNQNKNSCQTDFEFIQEHLPKLMEDISLKSWVIPPDFESNKEKLEIYQSNANTGCMTILACLGLIVLINYLIK